MNEKVHILILIKLFFFNIIYCGNNFNNIFINQQSFIIKYINWNQDFLNKRSFVYPLHSLEIDDEVFNEYFINNLSSKYIKLSFQPKIESNVFNRTKFIIDNILIFKLNDNLIWQNNFEFDSDGFDDNNYSGRLRKTSGKWTAYAQHSSFTKFYKNSHLLVGKVNISFLGQAESLFLNSYHPPVPTIWWHLKNEKIILDQAILFLDKIEHDYTRNLIFHRYALKLNNFELGFTESLIVSYKNFSQTNINYFLPAAVFFEAEVNGSSNANLFWIFDGKYFNEKYLFYYELLVDDISIDRLSPNKIGLNISILIKHNKFKSRLQYTRLNRWVGNYADENLRLISNDIYLGNQIGPDAHKIEYSAFKMIENFSFLLKFGILEKGQGNIEEWPDGVEAGQNFGWSKERFPSGAIKKEKFVKMEFDYFFKNNKIAVEYLTSNRKKPSYKIGVMTYL